MEQPNNIHKSFLFKLFLKKKKYKKRNASYQETMDCRLALKILPCQFASLSYVN